MQVPNWAIGNKVLCPSAAMELTEEYNRKFLSHVRMFYFITYTEPDMVSVKERRKRSSLPSSYKMPKRDWAAVHLGTVPKEKRMDYVTLVSETSKGEFSLTKVFPCKNLLSPGPLAYSKIKNWSDVHTGTIAKSPKVTTIAAIFLACRKSKSPAPNTYEPKEKRNIGFKFTKT